MNLGISELKHAGPEEHGVKTPGPAGG